MRRQTQASRDRDPLRRAAPAPAAGAPAAPSTQPALPRARPGARGRGRAAPPALRPGAGSRPPHLDHEPGRLLPAARGRSGRSARLTAARPGRAQLPARARPLRRPPARAAELGPSWASGHHEAFADWRASGRGAALAGAGRLGPVAAAVLRLREGGLGAQLRADGADAVARSLAAGPPAGPARQRRHVRLAGGGVRAARRRARAGARSG